MMSCDSDDSSSSSYTSTSESTEYEFDLLDGVSYLCGLLRSSLQSGGGVKEMGNLSLTYGNTNQAFLNGKYAGLQCTSMALAAIIYNTTHPKWTPKKINTILTEGDRLHTFLRDELKLSVNTDGKIGIEDIPFKQNLDLRTVFGKQTAVKLRHRCQNVFTTKPDGFEQFLTIKDYLEKWKPIYTNRCGFLITIRGASYAIILKKKGTVALFDSHGHLERNGFIIKERAGVLKLPSIQVLDEFLVNMYGYERQAVIVPVHVSIGPSVILDQKSERKVRNQSQVVYTPYIPEEQATDEQTEQNKEHTEESCNDDSSPYIGMFGGGW